MTNKHILVIIKKCMDHKKMVGTMEKIEQSKVVRSVELGLNDRDEWHY